MGAQLDPDGQRSRRLARIFGDVTGMLFISGSASTAARVLAMETASRHSEAQEFGNHMVVRPVQDTEKRSKMLEGKDRGQRVRRDLTSKY